MLKNVPIRLKLLGAFFVLALFTVLIVFSSIIGLQTNRQALDHIALITAPRIQALLQMKSVAHEVDKNAATFQFLGSFATQSDVGAGADSKYGLLASLERLNKWEHEYTTHKDAADAQTLAVFSGQIDSARTAIVDAALQYISLKERGLAGTSTTQAAAGLTESVQKLQKLIEDEIVVETEALRLEENTVRANANHVAEFDTIVAVITLLVAIVLGFFLSRLIARPIKTLRDAALRIAGGDLSQVVSVTSKDELGVLAKAFNDMTTKIKWSYLSLEDQVKATEEKSKELNVQVDETEKSKRAVVNLLEDVAEEKKKAEATVVVRTHELTEEKARLLASINSLSFGFVIADATDHVLLSNPALMTILELSTNPQSVHDIAEAFKTVSGAPTIVDEVFNPVQSCKECVELKQAVEKKEILYGKKFLRFFCAPIFAQDTVAQLTKTEVIGYVLLIEDITEAKVLERSRDEFFSIASHELRTPLTAIQGNASMLLDYYADKLPDDEMKQMLQDISSAGVRLIKIVNDFLEVSRLEQGRLKFEGTTFAVTEVVEGVLSDVKSLAEKKSLQLRYDPPATVLPQVFADKDRVKQILINLLGNAINYSTDGSITITLLQEGEYIKVRVKDNGVGISAEHQSLLFRKFQQAGDTLARDVTQSTGLGLYISKLMIEGMGGGITLEESQPGKGSTFAFILPIAPHS